MGKRIFKFFKIWGNLVIAAITVYPFIVAVFFPGISQGGELKSLFGWSWQTWLNIFLISIIITFVIQNLYEKYEKDSVANKTRISSEIKAEDSSVASKNQSGGFTGNNKGTFIQGGEHKHYSSISSQKDLTKNELRNEIGEEVLRFSERFSNIHFASKKDRYDRLNDAKDFIQSKIKDLHFKAIIRLSDTMIPELMYELQNYFVQYESQVTFLDYLNDEQWKYIQVRETVPPELKKEIIDNAKKVDKTIKEMNDYINQLTELCKDSPNWWMS